MLRLAFDFIITWRETRTRPNAYWKNWITGAKLRTFLFQNKYNRLINRCPFENKLGMRGGISYTHM